MERRKMSMDQYNEMQNNVELNLQMLIGKTITNVTVRRHKKWDLNFAFKFDDGTILEFGEDSYDPLEMKLNGEDIY